MEGFVTDISNTPSIEGAVDLIRFARRFLGKRWRLVTFAAVCGAIIGCLLTFAVHPTYTAQATLYVAPPLSSSVTDAVSGDKYAQDRAQMYWQLAKNDELAQRVLAEIRSPESPAALANRISVALIYGAPLLTIQVTAQSPDAARSLAQAYLDQLPNYARSVEQNSGLREGPVLVTVARPIEVSESTAGVAPWLKVLLFAALFGGAALIYTVLNHRRHPTIRGVGQLRKAVSAPWIVEVDGSRDEMARIQAMLFSAPNSARKVVLAGARSDDGLGEMIAEFRTALLPGPRFHLNDVEIFAAPALLDQHERMTALAARSSTGIMISGTASVIVCLKGQTLLEDVVDLDKLLSFNGVDVKGILVARRQWRKRAKQRVASREQLDDAVQPELVIEVVQNGKPSQNGNGSVIGVVESGKSSQNGNGKVIGVVECGKPSQNGNGSVTRVVKSGKPSQNGNGKVIGIVECGRPSQNGDGTRS
jgi:capsular polysaccharide biosynthesis protein